MRSNHAEMKNIYEYAAADEAESTANEQNMYIYERSPHAND